MKASLIVTALLILLVYASITFLGHVQSKNTSDRGAVEKELYGKFQEIPLIRHPHETKTLHTINSPEMPSDLKRSVMSLLQKRDPKSPYENDTSLPGGIIALIVCGVVMGGGVLAVGIAWCIARYMGRI